MPIDHEKMKRELPDGTQFECVMFPHYRIPLGFLDSTTECHALFWYYLNARRTYDQQAERMEVVLEGDKDPAVNYHQLFESIAYQYGVLPAHMAKCWDLVDMQAQSLGMPLLPKENKYRHHQIIVVN